MESSGRWQGPLRPEPLGRPLGKVRDGWSPLETRSKRWVDITGGRDPILGTIFIHIYCVPSQASHPNATCVMGTPAMAPTQRVMVNWDCAIQGLSKVPDPQSVSSTC